MGVFNKDIVLDEEAFATAAADFDALGKQLQKLRNEIEEMMKILQEGFNTPAGVKFINACEKNLYRPMDAQRLVLEHIGTTLKSAQKEYASVFREYEALQKQINQVKNGTGS